MSSRSAEPVAGFRPILCVLTVKARAYTRGRAGTVLLAVLASADADRVGLCWRIAFSGAAMGRLTGTGVFSIE